MMLFNERRMPKKQAYLRAGLLEIPGKRRNNFIDNVLQKLKYNKIQK